MKTEFGPIEKTTVTEKDLEIKSQIDNFYRSCPEKDFIKLSNFTRFVPRQVLSKFLCRYEIFKKVLNVHGSVVECGVLNGGSLFGFAQMSAILEPLNHQRKIIGFDTFAGFPHIHDKDKTGISSNLNKGGYDADSYEQLLENIKIYDSNRSLSHIPKIELVKGDILETLPKYLQTHPHLVVSLLYLDVDLYEPTKLALKLLRPRMPKGAVIIFDELNCEGFPGETIAVQEELGIPNISIERFSFDTNISYAVL